jgi:hypothetical protein
LWELPQEKKDLKKLKHRNSSPGHSASGQFEVWHAADTEHFRRLQPVNKKREHSISISCSALATHRYQNNEKKRLTKHVRITAFVGQQWSKTNVQVIPAFSGSQTAPQR